MNCPECEGPIEAADLSCPHCGAILPGLESREGEAAAPAPGSNTPSARSTPTPEARRRAAAGETEPTWRNEVVERVRERRRDRGITTEASEELPLFRERPAAAPSLPVMPAQTQGPVELGDEEPGDGTQQPAATGEALLDFDLRPKTAPPAARTERQEDDEEFEEASPDETGEEGWPAPPVPARGARDVERPASPVERVQAAAIDMLVLAALGAFVVYFSAKAARTDLAGLFVMWRFVAGYLAGLGLLYAAYFTGITGHTPGKMLLGLRVVDTRGAAPGFARALARVVLGVVGIAAACVGLVPMLFDPARRALHDRLVKTRVVRV